MSIGFVSKIAVELDVIVTVLEPNSKDKHAGPRGVGSKSLSLEDQQILLELLEGNLFWTPTVIVNICMKSPEHMNRNQPLVDSV